MATKPIIAVDIDEVLFPLAPTFLDYHNSAHGTNFSLDQLTSYYVEDLTGESEEEVIKKIKHYLKTEHFTLGEPIPGAVEAIKELRRKFRLVLITARDHFYRGHTEEFINAHFGDLFDELRYTHNIDNPNVRIPKHQICKELSAKALIDDHLHNVIECASNGIDALLFGDYPWNQVDRLPLGVTRVKSWQDVLEYFDAKAAA